MRVLLISDRLPLEFPFNTHGTYRRLEMFVQAFREIAQIDLLLYVHPKYDLSQAAIARQEMLLSDLWETPITLKVCPKRVLPRWRQRLEGMVDFSHQIYFSSASGTQQLQAFEACLDRQPDLIFAHRLQSMAPVLKTRHELPPVLFDLDDVEHAKFMRELRNPPSRLETLLYYLHVPALVLGERQAIYHACTTFVCSEHDRQYLSERWQLPGITVIPNAAIIPVPHPLSPEPTLMMLGNHNYPPNAYGAKFLMQQVFPRVKQTIPTARLVIAGSTPPIVKHYGDGIPGIEFAGFVEDLDELYQRSRVVCCPIFTGGGTRVKMVEAAAYGKPIVATRIGAEGLDLVPEQDYLLRDTAEEFAAACIDLLINDDHCTQLGHNARQVATQLYAREKVIARIQDCIREAGIVASSRVGAVKPPHQIVTVKK